jgi:ubiquinone/menaquinone biosynthesis C-methylase UbiE
MYSCQSPSSIKNLIRDSFDLSEVHDILDIACGPGSWVLDVAFEYAKKRVMGIDLSRLVIEYTRAQARVQGLDNASFKVMDALKPLELPDNSFDLVNARFLFGFMAIDMLSDDFYSIGFSLTVWDHKL